MPHVLHLLFVVLALACFILATWGPAEPNWHRLTSAGLAFLTASMITWPGKPRHGPTKGL